MAYAIDRLPSFNLQYSKFKIDEAALTCGYENPTLRVISLLLIGINP
ncbi:MAG: hypothetical protein LBI89_01595 [Prevotellaceae bacterium]|jgi:hypothetical protein|nr:hypothetical protein [Prevotellaceae bacterium]